MKFEHELDHGVEGLINEFAIAAKIAPDLLIARILSFRDQEMSELLEFAQAYPEGSDKHEEVFTLMSNYSGGSYIYEEMKRIDPAYLTPGEFAMSIDDDLLNGLFASLSQSLVAPEASHQ